VVLQGRALNPDEFVDYLNTIFLDPYLSGRAINRLRTLRQGEKESFSTFLPRFKKELANSRLRDAGDAVEISYLEGALNSQMSAALITMPTEEHYAPYVQQLARIHIVNGNFMTLSSRPKTVEQGEWIGHQGTPSVYLILSPLPCLTSLNRG
jgi:hypothetical protein